MHFFQRLLPGLEPTADYPPHFWSLDKSDLLPLASMSLVILSLWTTALLVHGKYGIISYWDGPNYIYASITLYRIPPNNPWTRSFRYPPSYFACHLPGLPLAIRFFSTLLFNKFLPGAHLTIFVTSLLQIYLFRRVLWIYGAVQNPARSALLLSLLPVRLVVYHAVGASEPLFLACVSLAFIFLKANRTLPLFLAVAAACATRVEGLALLGTVGLCLCLRLDLARAAVVACDLLAPCAVMLLHRDRFRDWNAYFRFNQGHSGLVRLPPFFEIRDNARGSGDVAYHMSALALFAPFAVGTCLVFPVCVPFGIFAAVYLVFAASLWHVDVYRYALPGYVFALFVGFDEVWASKAADRGLLWALVAYAALAFWYAMGQIGSNVAPAWFTDDVLHAAVEWW